MHDARARGFVQALLRIYAWHAHDEDDETDDL